VAWGAPKSSLVARSNPAYIYIYISRSRSLVIQFKRALLAWEVTFALPKQFNNKGNMFPGTGPQNEYLAIFIID